MQGEGFDLKLRKKCYFMVKKGIDLVHVISYDEIAVDRVKISLIANLTPPS